jgi:hypothetical protein
MPCLDNGRFVLHNETTDLVELSWAEPMIPRKFDGRQPELGVLSISPKMNMHGLVAIEAIEKEPIRPWNIWDLRHSARLHAR